MLMFSLKDYKVLHRAITHLLKTKTLIRVKNGFYIFGENFRDGFIHRGLLANLIYGPSYVSMEYALAFHGMIPERVEMITSMTTKRNKLFNTPIGDFSFTHLNQDRYSIGIEWSEIGDKQHFLLASREKALVDTIASHKKITKMHEMQQHLIENLRIDESSLWDLDLKFLEKINQSYKKPIINLLIKTLLRGF